MQSFPGKGRDTSPSPPSAVQVAAEQSASSETSILIGPTLAEGISDAPSNASTELGLPGTELYTAVVQINATTT